MIIKCKKCGKSYDIGILKFVESLWSGKKIFICETCEDIIKWKRSEDIDQLVTNRFDYYECSVSCYDYRLYIWIYERIIYKNEYCELTLIGDIKYNCFPCKIEKDYLVCAKDEFDPKIEYGTHRIGNIEKSIPLNIISKVKRLDRFKDYFEPEVEKPVYGYKGVDVVDGIIKAKNYIYEIGIPYEEPQRIRSHTDFQDVYSHFCIKIEDVLRYRDFITSPITYSKGKGQSNERLFEVKGEGHCFQNTADGWVSNKLTLIREVPREEIIEYFNQSQNLKLILKNFLESDNYIYEEVWDEYAKADIKPYSGLLTYNEIEENIVMSCSSFNGDMCIQDCSELSFKTCERCTYYKYSIENKKKRHCYLTVRNSIREGTFSKESINYKYLLENNYTSEIEAIHRLLEYNL